MKKATLTRFESSDKQTLGKLEIDNWSCCTLELPWRDNNQGISCIPAGTYRCVRRESQKYGQHWHLQAVPKRSFILIHAGNYFRQIQGCILVGLGHTDIDGDGLRDVTSSVSTLKALNKLIPGDSFTLLIKDK
jgi:hypothetical protein